MSDELWPKIVLDPNVPEGEIHARDAQANLIGRIIIGVSSPFPASPKPGQRVKRIDNKGDEVLYDYRTDLYQPGWFKVEE